MRGSEEACSFGNSSWELEHFKYLNGWDLYDQLDLSVRIKPQTANHELFAGPGANNVGLVRHDA
jgi:hypothetical protein